MGEATFGMEVWDEKFIRAVTLKDLKEASQGLKGEPAAVFWRALGIESRS